jgi:ankyrin repeat protein
MTLQEFLDFHYGPDGKTVLLQRLADGEDPDRMVNGETGLHVAVRRRRELAVRILLQHGVNIDARNQHGKTALAHAARRGFDELVELLTAAGADDNLNVADRFAVSIIHGEFDRAKNILADHPDCVRTGNPGEDRLLADVAGRGDSRPIFMLIEAGADLSATGLDSGTALHQAAWFGQSENASLLIDAGAPLDVFDCVHNSSPLGWAVHGSRYSGNATQRQDEYVALVGMLLEAGSSLRYPGEPDSDRYLNRLRTDASYRTLECLPTTL